MINQHPKNPSPRDIKIIFFGTSDFATPALKSLINFGYQIDLVVTQPEKPVGRARVVMPSPVKQVAQEFNLKVLEPHNLKRDEEFFEKFKDLNPDACIIASYGKIIPPNYFEVPRFGFINIHPSLLPKYRGPSPIQKTILNSDEETGVTIMKIDEEMDHGPILVQKTYNLQPTTYYKQAEKELSELGAEMLIDILPQYINGGVELKEQDHSKSTFTKKFSREDGKINWTQPAKEIYNQIRALNPEPGTWTTFNSKTLNIKKSHPIKSDGDGESVGTVKKMELNRAESSTDNKLSGAVTAVKTADGYLVLETVQLEGKKEMNVQSFVNGHGDFVGSVL